jgi:hypothetical protein
MRERVERCLGRQAAQLASASKGDEALMPSDKTNEHTRREWRDLGFHYSRNDKSRLWIIEGSPEGLVAFATLLRKFAGDLASDPALDHEHYGPYVYLELMRSERADVTGHCIQGSPPDFLRLAEIVERCIGVSGPGESASIGGEFAPSSPYQLLLRVRPPGTDPASLDPQLVSDAGTE